jgi:protein phosphatase
VRRRSLRATEVEKAHESAPAAAAPLSAPPIVQAEEFSLLAFPKRREVRGEGTPWRRRAERLIETDAHGAVAVDEKRWRSAEEHVRSSTVDSRWLVYLPPMVPPPEAGVPRTPQDPLTAALAYFGREGAGQVVCEEEHPGPRTVVVVCRDPETAEARFGVADGSVGAAFTRRGQRAFAELEVERELLQRVRIAATGADLWASLKTSWLVLDCAFHGPRPSAAAGARAGTRLAPFHLMASEGSVHAGRDHRWHLETLAWLCRQDPELLQETPSMVCDPADGASPALVASWHAERAEAGSRGSIVKPLAFTVTRSRRLVQPAIRVPSEAETRPAGAPRSNPATQQFALGLEGLERFLRREPFERVRECVLGVLALEP